jgi:AcrR family transcriptional regulator
MPLPSAAPAAEPLAEGRRERRKLEVRQRIYGCAARLFLEQGFAATTVDQIAAAADVAPATLFNHFASKDALLHELSAEVVSLVQALIEGQRKRPVATRARLAEMAEQAAALLAHARHISRDVLLDLMRNTAPPGSAGPVLARIHGSFGELLRDGQARGDVRRDEDVLFLAEMMVGVFYAAVTNWLNDPGYPLDQRLRRTAEFIGEAISAPESAPRGGVAARRGRRRRG